MFLFYCSAIDRIGWCCCCCCFFIAFDSLPIKCEESSFQSNLYDFVPLYLFQTKIFLRGYDTRSGHRSAHNDKIRLNNNETKVRQILANEWKLWVHGTTWELKTTIQKNYLIERENDEIFLWSMIWYPFVCKLCQTFFTTVFHRCPLNCNEWHIIMMKMSSLWMGKLAHSVHIVPLFWITVLLLFYTKFQFQMTISYAISLFLLLPYFSWFIWISVEFKLKIFQLTVIFMIFQLFEWIPNTRFYHVMFTLLYSSLLNVENWFPLRSKKCK